MLKPISFALMASVATLTTLAQNLVPNPSFEEYLECPFGTAELANQVVGWTTWQESPDFFHVCSNDLDGFAGVPENAWGIQWPLTGNGYAGIITYIESDSNIREYMAAPLESPLVNGNSYYMMLHASMYDGGSKDFRWCSTSNIGMRFFKDPVYTAFPPDANPLQPDNFAHLNFSEVLDDYTNWTIIDGWFTADDDYNWVAIGNFFTGDQTEIVIMNDENRCAGIYYIENVCVASTPEDCEYLLSVEARRPTFKASLYPNPATEMVRLGLSEGDAFNVVIYELQGRMVKTMQNISSGQEINVSAFQKGVYVVRVSNNQYFTTIKLIVK